MQLMSKLKRSLQVQCSQNFLNFQKSYARRREEGRADPGSNFPPIISSRSACMCVYLCVRACSQILVQMRSEKDLPSPHWFSVLESNLWVGAPRWEVWKLGPSSSQDEWEEGAHQRAEPSGWAQIRSFFFLVTCIKYSLLFWCQITEAFECVYAYSILRWGAYSHFIAFAH